MIIFKPHQARDIITSFLPQNAILLEAGAFTGHDTVKMSNQFPDATIHAFEPVPLLFEQLQNRTRDISRIHCYPYALSNRVGTATFYLSEKEDGRISQAGSLDKPIEDAHHLLFKQICTVQTTTIDHWIEQYNIPHIDCAWLDLQGHELKALKGAQKALQHMRILHVEVNFIARYEGQPLYRDVVAFFEKHEFVEYGRDFTEPRTSFGNVIFIAKKYLSPTLA